MSRPNHHRPPHPTNNTRPEFPSMTLHSINVPSTFPPQKSTAADSATLPLDRLATGDDRSNSFFHSLTGLSLSPEATTASPGQNGTKSANQKLPFPIHSTVSAPLPSGPGPGVRARAPANAAPATQASDDPQAIIQLLLVGARSSSQQDGPEENPDGSSAPDFCPPLPPGDGLGVSVIAPSGGQSTTTAPMSGVRAEAPAGPQPAPAEPISIDAGSNSPTNSGTPSSSPLPPGETSDLGELSRVASSVEPGLGVRAGDAQNAASAATTTRPIAASTFIVDTSYDFTQPAAGSAQGTDLADSLGRAKQLVDRAISNARTTFDEGGVLRVRLDPPGLGKMQIEISAQDGPIVARVSVESAGARQTLLDNISALHGAIAQAGAPDARIDIELSTAPRDLSDSRSNRHSDDGRSAQSDSQDETGNQSNSSARRNRRWLRVPSIDQIDIEV
jgi:flagellar hook-length control protein FliK